MRGKRFITHYSRHSLSRHPRDLTNYVEISECRHKRRRRIAYEFIMCLMYKVCMLTYVYGSCM